MRRLARHVHNRDRIAGWKGARRRLIAPARSGIRGRMSQPESAIVMPFQVEDALW
jgi:hypothetical protein